MENNKYTGILKDLKNLLKIQSVLSEPEEGMPFGKENYRALKYMLDLGEKNGFKTKNVDGYAGHIEWGEGEEIFGVLCHLDVVPAGENWKYPPFSAITKDGKIYARGAIDDKSPAVAVLYAIKRLKKEGFIPHKKFRLIMGLNEESGWKCIEYYMKKEKMPDSGFSPDADFPVINCEKGVLFLKISFSCKDNNIKAVFGGNRVNMVPDSAGYELLAGEKQTFTGVSAHGSHPEKGINAVSKMILELKGKTPDKSVSDIYNAFCNSFSLKNLHIDLSDEKSGKLTLNLGTIENKDGKIICKVDIRYPVSFDNELILKNIKDNLPKDCKVEIINYHRPLYIPENDELVIKLLNAYDKVTGLKGKCISIGGATYSRSIDKCVAFGPVFPDEDSKIHTADESVEIKRLYMMTEIYYEALKTLLQN